MSGSDADDDPLRRVIILVTGAIDEEPKSPYWFGPVTLTEENRDRLARWEEYQRYYGGGYIHYLSCDGEVGDEEWAEMMEVVEEFEDEHPERR